MTSTSLKIGVGDDKHKDNIGYDIDALGQQLGGIAIKQTGDRSLDGVPGVAVRAVGKQPQGDNPPGAADAVHRDGAHGIVHLQVAAQ